MNHDQHPHATWRQRSFKGMITTPLARRVRAGLLLAAALVAAVSLLAAPASAASATTASPHLGHGILTPFAAQGCSGDACIHLSTPSGGTVTVRGWARNRTFYGHFELTGPRGLIKNSPNNWNYAGGNGHSWTVSAVVGQYCITAWEYYGGQYFKLGRACENVL